jgi:hypothetical protein
MSMVDDSVGRMQALADVHERDVQKSNLSAISILFNVLVETDFAIFPYSWLFLVRSTR